MDINRIIRVLNEEGLGRYADAVESIALTNAALRTEVAQLKAELKALGEQEPVAHIKRGTIIWGGSGYVAQARVESVTATADWPRSKADIPLYTSPAPKVPAGVLKLFDDAVEAARLLGHRQADKLHGIYTKESSMCEVAHYQSIDKRRAELRAMLSATQAKGEE